MQSFGKRNYTIPVICKHKKDLTKDWYVSFGFKYLKKVYRYKRREGINRIKKLQKRILAINILRNEIEYDLKHGWNPLLDKKREYNYNPYLRGLGAEDHTKPVSTWKKKQKPKKEKAITKKQLIEYYFKK